MNLDLSKMVGVKRQPVYHLATLAATPVSPYSGWTKYAIPTYSQKFPSCVGHGTANWIEMMLRRHVSRDIIPKYFQIDGDAIWRKGREMFWPNEDIEVGGLYPDQGFKAAIELGILPSDTMVGSASMDVGMVSRLLRTVPVLQGTAVWKEWESPNKENGQISVGLPNPQAGHLTVIVGVLEQDGEPYILFQNSWGAGWGYHGYGLLRADQWEQALLGPLAFAKISDSFKTHDGWRRYLIKLPDAH